MSYEIRPMSFGEILDTAFQMIRNHFGLMIGLAAVQNLPPALLLAIVAPEMLGFYSDEAIAANLSGIAIGSGINLIYFLLVSPIVAAALTAAVADQYRGRETSVADALRASLSIFFPLVGTSLLLYLAVILGFLFLILPGIYLAFAFALTWEVMVIERIFGPGAMGRSRELMKDNFFRAFGIFLTTGLLFAVISGGIGFVAAAIPLVGMLVNVLIQCIGQAFFVAVTVVLYFDIRCRKEDFDLEHLAAQLTPEASHEG